jgi:predicted nucleotidyltransferase
MLSACLKQKIITLLNPLRPDKVILFGSYAWGTPRTDSDLDLYVVASEENMPENFKERSELYIKYGRALDSLYEEYPVDLIVHSKPMHSRFIETGSSFAKKIMAEGERLL